MNNFCLFLLLPFTIFSQNLYIKPVNFFDYFIYNWHNQFLLFLNDEDNINQYAFFLYENDTLKPLNYPIKLPNQDTLFHILINNSNHEITSYLSIDFNPQFLIQDSLQVCHHYLKQNNKYRIIGGFSEIKIYKKTYQTPLPPYIFYKKKHRYSFVEKTCSLDFSKIKANDLIVIHSLNDSIGIPVFSEYYPDLQLIDSLNAMVYLLTKSEFKFLKKVNKKSYLNFIWNGFDEEKKMNLKDLYFKRVYEANLYFHENDEGWRTERGMIYIIFGTPDAIVLYEGYEDWFYERTQLNDRPVFFRFKIQKKKGFKTEYILERKNEFFDIWNDAVDAWRNGLIIKEK